MFRMTARASLIDAYLRYAGIIENFCSREPSIPVDRPRGSATKVRQIHPRGLIASGQLCHTDGS
jgi:hypothetical protein